MERHKDGCLVLFSFLSFTMTATSYFYFKVSARFAFAVGKGEWGPTFQERHRTESKSMQGIAVCGLCSCMSYTTITPFQYLRLCLAFKEPFCLHEAIVEQVAHGA